MALALSFPLTDCKAPDHNPSEVNLAIYTDKSVADISVNVVVPNTADPIKSPMTKTLPSQSVVIPLPPLPLRGAIILGSFGTLMVYCQIRSLFNLETNVSPKKVGEDGGVVNIVEPN